MRCIFLRDVQFFYYVVKGVIDVSMSDFLGFTMQSKLASYQFTCNVVLSSNKHDPYYCIKLVICSISSKISCYDIIIAGGHHQTGAGGHDHYR